MRKSDLSDHRRVQAAVRQVADRFLDDPNINSVGIGYRLKDGARTSDLVRQFTVDAKVAPEALEAQDTRLIPATIPPTASSSRPMSSSGAFARSPRPSSRGRSLIASAASGRCSPA